MLRKKTRVFASVLSLILCVAMLFGCAQGGGEQTTDTGTTGGDSAADTTPDYSEPMNFTATSPYFLETGVDYMDALSKDLLDEYNMTVEVIPVSLSDFSDKNRIWITSGDMPDVVWSNLIYSDYVKYAEQDLVRALPDDYETKYPNLTEAMVSSNGYDTALKEAGNGKLYATVKPIYKTKFADIFVSHTTLYYRMDWAEAVGFEVKDQYTLDEVMEMTRLFVEQDPGGNGEGNTIPFAVEPANMIYTFTVPYLSHADKPAAKNEDGVYEYGPAQPEVADGLQVLRDYYDEGLIYSDFFSIKVRGEVEAMLYAGQTGTMINGGAFGNVKRIFDEFTKSTGLDAMEVIGMANILGEDGKIHSTEMANIQSIGYYNPNMEDEKFDRILAILDKSATDEFQNKIHLGFEGTDYEMDGEEIVITRDTDENGNFVPISDIYPSYNLWNMITIAWDDFAVRDPSTNPELLERIKDLFNDRVENGNINYVDFDLTFFSGPNYDKITTIKQVDAFTNMIINNDEIKPAFDAWVEENSAVIDAAMDDLNSNLVG